MLKAALTWGMPRSPSWEHVSCSDPRLGWPGDPGEAVRSIRSLWSSFPVLGRGGLCLVLRTDSDVSEVVCSEPGQDGLPCIPQPSRLPQRGTLERLQALLTSQSCQAKGLPALV